MFEELLMPHGKLKKHFLSETMRRSVYIIHFLLFLCLFLLSVGYGTCGGARSCNSYRQRSLLQWELCLTNAGRIGLIQHLSPCLIASGSPAYTNSRDLLGIMMK